MVNGEPGLHGHLVEIIARSQGQEAVTVLLLPMEETLVLVLMENPHHALEVTVHQYMVNGELGDPGHDAEELDPLKGKGFAMILQ